MPKAAWFWPTAFLLRRQLGCTHLVDAATLTGAVVVALGFNNAGIFANDDDMYNRFHTANVEGGREDVAAAAR